MLNFGYPQSFGIIVPTVYGPIICNRYDAYHTPCMIATRNDHVQPIRLLSLFLSLAPEGAVCLDIGGNYALFGLTFARLLSPKNGVCHSFEAQRPIAYAAAGTVALSGVHNLYIHHLAIGDTCGEIPAPKIDYNRVVNLGGIQFRSQQKEKLDQTAHSPDTDKVPLATIDSLNFENVYLMKLDIESMEVDALNGAKTTILRDKPILFIEYDKAGPTSVASVCKDFGYHVYLFDHMNFLCIHSSRIDDYQELGLKLHQPDVRMLWE